MFHVLATFSSEKKATWAKKVWKLTVFHRQYETKNDGYIVRTTKCSKYAQNADQCALKVCLKNFYWVLHYYFCIQQVRYHSGNIKIWIICLWDHYNPSIKKKRIPPVYNRMGGGWTCYLPIKRDLSQRVW